MYDRSKAVTYADQHWFQPCRGGVVWTANEGINLAEQAQNRKLDPAQWVGRFLFYPSGGKIAEGLFLLPVAEASPANLKAQGFDSQKFPNKHFICSWSDNTKESTDGQTPPYTGLNDCTHFTSSCVMDGGPGGEPSLHSLGAGEFVGKLRARPDIKTLCLGVDKELARRMINSGPLDRGDVVAFSHNDGFHHAILYLGNRKVAAHTHCNHPDGPSFNFTNESDGGINNWEISANTSHPLVTLLHFTQGDSDPSHTKWLPGWWMFQWRGQTIFYHFDAVGRVRWTRTPPPSTIAPPPISPSGQGYWFVRNSIEITLCWTRTGTFEKLRQISPLEVKGDSNGEQLSGIRLTL